MCGIGGKVYFAGANLSKTMVRNIQKALRHRGPDGRGEYFTNEVGMVMRRLSIIDIAGGNQPLYNESKNIVLVGNGEIYNYLELRRGLRKKGHQLTTEGDIETAVHLYEDLGPMFVKKLRGMFALAIYDEKRHKLILARDRLGEKPLYYSLTGQGVVFASEMKGIIQDPMVNKEIDWGGIDLFFHFYYIPEPRTMFQAVKKLPAGYVAEIDLTGKKLKLIKYWDGKDIVPKTNQNPTQIVKETFAQACELTLRSDVPVGIALSGGIDSGAILTFSAPKYKDTMKAFSVGYEGQVDSDETEMAKKLANKFKVEFIQTKLKTKDMVEHFPKLVWDGDDPIADIAGYSIYSVSQLSRHQGVPVLLGGIGGDELFWGYPSTVEATKRNIQNLNSWWRKISRKEVVFANPDPRTAGLIAGQIYGKQFRDRLIPGEISSLVNETRILASPLDVAKHEMDLVRDLWLESNCIALNDRLSMAASIELRSPFLDYKLVETALSSIPLVEGYKLPNKYWFKKAMAGIIPDEVLNRPKRGFTPPVYDWLKALISRYVKLTMGGFLIENNIFDSRKLKLMTDTWMAFPPGWYTIYQIIMLEIWGREYIWGQTYEDIIRAV